MEVWKEIVYPPNKPMDRSMKDHYLEEPPSELMFIDVNSKGEFITGNSCFTSSWWRGAVYYYKCFEDIKSYCEFHNLFNESTIADGLFIDDDTILVACDNGKLSMMGIAEVEGESKKLNHKDCFYIDCSPKQLDLWKNSKKMTSCVKTTLNVWSVFAGIAPIREYRDYHTDTICAVSCKQEDENIFISGSWDKKACIWDTRSEIPGIIIRDLNMGPATAVSFIPNNQNLVLLGMQNGFICLIDDRNPTHILSKCEAFQSDIFKIKVNKNFVGICGDTNEVKIVEINKDNSLQIGYIGSSHKKVVRGLCWHQDELYSCGFGNEVVKHVCY